MMIGSLSAENIDKASESIADFLSKNGLNKKEILHIRMMSEETLIKYLSLSGSGTKFRVVTEKKFGQLRVSLRVACECVDPFGDDDDEAYFLRKITRDTEITPVWNYSRGYNCIVFSIPVGRKIPDYVFVLGAIALAVALGISAKMLLGETCNVICDDYLTPLSDAIMGLIGTVSVLMVFVSIVSGVCGMGDIATLKNIGKKMGAKYGLYTVACTAACLAVLVLYFGVTSSEGGTFDSASLWKMIVGMIPTNILRAFTDGNTMQVIFLAVISAIMLLILSSKTQGLTDWITQANFHVQGILEIIIKAMPAVVFINIFEIVSSSDIADLSDVYKYPLFMVGICAAAGLYSLLSTAIIHRVPIQILMKKALPAFLVGLSTASSSTAFTCTMETCEKEYGISERLCRVGIPLGQIILKPTTIFELLVGCITFADIYNVEITVSKVVILAISATILAIAEPPVAGSTIASFTILLSQFGIPFEAISIILVLEPLLDRVATAIAIFVGQCELISLASSLGMIDKSVLRGAKK